MLNLNVGMVTAVLGILCSIWVLGRFLLGDDFVYIPGRKRHNWRSIKILKRVSVIYTNTVCINESANRKTNNRWLRFVRCRVIKYSKSELRLNATSVNHLFIYYLSCIQCKLLSISFVLILKQENYNIIDVDVISIFSI